MSKVSYIKNIINEKLKQAGLNNIALLLRFLTKAEEEELSRWFIVTREPYGFINFEKREGVFNEDNGQLKIF